MMDFDAGMEDLSRQVGHGTLTMRVVYDQVYAKYQELREDLHHPRGGQAHYCRDGLYNHIDEFMQVLARDAVVPVGSLLERGAREVVRSLDGHVGDLAPVEWYDLRRSGHCLVISDGVVVYDRPPVVPRLDREALRRKRREGGSYETRSGQR